MRVGRVGLLRRSSEKSRRSTVKILQSLSRSATRKSAAAARSIGRQAYLRFSSRIRGMSLESSGSRRTAPRSSISHSASCARGRSNKWYIASTNEGQTVASGSRNSARAAAHLARCWSPLWTNATSGPASIRINSAAVDVCEARRAATSLFGALRISAASQGTPGRLSWRPPVPSVRSLGRLHAHFQKVLEIGGAPRLKAADAW
jgi:hypothetical protein